MNIKMLWYENNTISVGAYLLSMIFIVNISSAYQVKDDLTEDKARYKKLTVLTMPIGDGRQSYEGHYAVTRSIVEGLRKIGVNFNYNPLHINEVGDVVFVPAGFDALRQAIQLRRNGRIKKLLAGPNLVGRGCDENNIVANTEIDVYFSPSYWPLINLLDDAPSLKGRMHVWYAGVDTNFWVPIPKKKERISKKVLVYWKTESEHFCIQVEEILKKYGWLPMRVRYGHYAKEQYKNMLSESAFAVFISRSESQGIALVEAWSMDVPTLVWEKAEPLLYREKIWWPISACPYLHPLTSVSWNTLEELDILLRSIPTMLPSFDPRNWVLRNMSDEVSAQLLLKIVNSPVNSLVTLPLD